MPDHHPTGHPASSHRDPLAVVLDAVGGAPRIRTDGSYLVRCPAHDDGTPSLSLACGDDGRALLHCHAGCSTEAVVAALGLRMADLFPRAGDRPARPPLPARPAAAPDRDGGAPGGPPPAAPPRPGPELEPGDEPDAGDGPYLTTLPIDPKVERHRRPWSHKDIAKEYVYRDEANQVVGRVVRLQPKGFRQQRPNGRGGWLWGLEGGQLPLYRLPQLVAAPKDEVVLVVEGEKDADALARMGMVATTCPGGAGRWQREFRGYFVGRAVAILPDNDPPGWNHAADVARDIFGLASEVRVVALPGVGPKGDVSDWLAAGGTTVRLATLVRAAKPVAFTGEWDEPLANLYPYARRPAIVLGGHGPHPGDGPDDPDGPPGPGGLDRPHGPTNAELDLPFTTARDLAERATSETRWLARPWLAAGAITELDGKAKASGKTTLATYLVRAILDGRPFLGEATARTPVVYLTEQSPPTFREALRRADLLGREDLSVLAWHDAAAAPWPDVVAAAVVRAKTVGAGLLVVDTLPQFAGLRGDAENNAGAALEAIAPLQVAAGSAGLAVLMLRHERKGGGEVGESGRGSSAFAGAVDVILQLKRPEGNTRPTLRVLSALSRFDETPDELVIELTAAGYVSHGDVAAVAVKQAEELLLAMLPASEAEAARLTDLVATAGTDLRRTTAQAAIAVLMGKGIVVRAGSGRRGDPIRYWKADGSGLVSAVPMVRVSAETIPSVGVEPTRLPLVSAGTTTLPAAETNGPPSVDGLPDNVIRIEDRRAPWDEEPEITGSSDAGAGADLPLVADLAAGCIEPDTCEEIGVCGEDGAAVCGPAVQPTLELARAPWAFDRVGDPAGRGRVAS